MTRLTDSGLDPLLWWCHYFRWKAVRDRVGVHYYKGETLDNALMTRSFKYWEDLNHDKLFLNPGHNPSHNHHASTRHNPDTHVRQGTLWQSGGSDDL